MTRHSGGEGRAVPDARYPSRVGAGTDAEAGVGVGAGRETHEDKKDDDDRRRYGSTREWSTRREDLSTLGPDVPGDYENDPISWDLLPSLSQYPFTTTGWFPSLEGVSSPNLTTVLYPSGPSVPSRVLVLPLILPSTHTPPSFTVRPQGRDNPLTWGWSPHSCSTE